MKVEKLKEKILLAHNAVKDEEEPYKLEAFKIILKNLLNGPDVIENKTSQTNEVAISSHEKHNPEGISELAKRCKINVEQLSDIISLKGNDIELIAKISGVESEKQIIAAQIILCSYEIILGQEWTKSTSLKESLRKSGITDPYGHLAGNLQKHESIFRIRGSGKGSEYKLTGPARTAVYEIISKLAPKV